MDASLLPERAEGVGIAGLVSAASAYVVRLVAVTDVPLWSTKPTSSRPFPHADITAPASASLGGSEARTE